MLQPTSPKNFCWYKPVGSFHLTSYLSLLFIHLYPNLLFPGFLWQHTLLIPMLPPWILVFSLIFKFFILYLFLRVWSLVLLPTTLLDKSSVIPRAAVGNSQSSIPTTPPFVLPVVPVSGNSFTIHWATQVGNTSCFGSFLSLTPPHPTNWWPDSVVPIS